MIVISFVWIQLIITILIYNPVCKQCKSREVGYFIRDMIFPDKRGKSDNAEIFRNVDCIFLMIWIILSRQTFRKLRILHFILIYTLSNSLIHLWLDYMEILTSTKCLTMHFLLVCGAYNEPLNENHCFVGKYLNDQLLVPPPPTSQAASAGNRT